MVVLVGPKTAGRKWINYEIEKAWKDGKGVVGIHVNKLEDHKGNTATKGSNPFSRVYVNGEPISQRVSCHTPSGRSSTETFHNIAANIEEWIEGAIDAR